MKVTISVFRRMTSDHTHTTTQGLLFLPDDAVDRIGTHLIDVNGTLVTGLSLSSAQAETKEVARFSGNPSGKVGVRMWLRKHWIGYEAPEHSKTLIKIEVEEPRRGVLTLPPLALATAAWQKQVTGADYAASKRAKQEALDAAGIEAVAAQAVVPVKATRAAKPPAIIPPPRSAALIDLGELMSAVDFVNEALVTGLVLPHLSAGGKIRLALNLKGG